MQDTRYPPTPRTTASRLRDRMSYDRAAVWAVLDEALHCHLAFAVRGAPRVLPTLQVRLGDTLYLHGSTGSRPLLAARGPDGLPVSVAVTLLDGLVLARSHFHHSVNYRSVVAHGTARLVEDDDTRLRVLNALVDKVARGRSTDSRPPSRKELAETAVLALPLSEAAVKVRVGGVSDEPADHALPYWAGVVPLRQVAGPPVPDAGVTRAVPDYLRPDRSPWLAAAPMRGAHVALEPLDMSHVDDLFAALDDPEVWRHLTVARPHTRDDLAGVVADALAGYADGTRVPWLLREPGTGAVIGTTSYYDVLPESRSLAIGYTVMGRPWWRTGVNTEAKLMLLERAFDELDAVRVVWHTDIRNARSQRAVERLGATREGVLRKQKQRPDGSWRDTVQYAMTDEDWPAVRQALLSRLRGPAAA